LLIEALIPMKLTLPEGVKTLKAGDQVNLPEDKARKLLKLAKEKVRVLSATPFRIGDWVRYQIPTFKGERHTGWTEKIGVVEDIDRDWHLVLFHEGTKWVWVNLSLVDGTRSY